MNRLLPSCLNIRIGKSLLNFMLIGFVALSGSLGHAEESECTREPEKFSERLKFLFEKAACQLDGNFKSCSELRGLGKRGVLKHRIGVAAVEVNNASAMVFIQNRISSTGANVARGQVIKAAIRPGVATAIAEEADMQVARALFASAMTSGAQALAIRIAAYSIFGAATVAVIPGHTACDTLMDFYVDRDNKKSCELIEGLTPKFLNFMNLSLDEQMHEMRMRPGLCEAFIKIYEHESRPSFTSASCLPGGGINASHSEIRMEFGADGRELTSFSSNTASTVPPYQFGSVRYNENGNASKVCLNRIGPAEPSECNVPMKITSYSADGKAHFENYRIDSAPIVETAQAAINQARVYYCDLVDALACCSPEDGEAPNAKRCADFGIKPGSNLPPTELNRRARDAAH